MSIPYKMVAPQVFPKWQYLDFAGQIPILSGSGVESYFRSTKASQFMSQLVAVLVIACHSSVSQHDVATRPDNFPAKM